MQLHAASTPALSPWSALSDTERAALREVLVHGPRSRAEIARQLNLSKTSLTRVTRRLVDFGLLAEGNVELRGSTGRPSELLHARLESHRFFGVKLTGDSLYCVVTDLGARVIASVEQPIHDRAVDRTLDQISEIYQAFADESPGISAAGICVAGDVAKVEGHEVVVDSPFLGWRNAPIAQMLSERWGIPVTVENDVRALTAAEHLFGAGAGCDSLALITVGTGVGFGIVSSGRLVEGVRGGAGRIDHLIIDRGGPICAYGHRGCASVYLPNIAIVRAMQLPGVDYAGAVQMAREGHRAAVRAFDDAAHALGVLIGTVANLLDPEKIVLTGDGLAIVEFAKQRMLDGIAEVRMPVDAETTLDIQSFEFEEWARGGAVAGIRAVLNI